MRQGAIPAALFLLCADEIAGYHLYCAFSNIVHTLHPSHLILLLQCLRDTLTNHHICHDVVEYELCLKVKLLEIRTQSTGAKELTIMIVQFTFSNLGIRFFPYHTCNHLVQVLPTHSGFCKRCKPGPQWSSVVILRHNCKSIQHTLKSFDCHAIDVGQMIKSIFSCGEAKAYPLFPVRKVLHK